MVASEHKFHAAPITSAQRERFACDLAFVSHHSQTPEAMHRIEAAMLSLLRSVKPDAKVGEAAH